MTQEEMVIKYLEENKTITSWEAIKEFGITRLSAKIYNLRKQGYTITGHDESGVNRFGSNVWWKVYRLTNKYKVDWYDEDMNSKGACWIYADTVEEMREQFAKKYAGCKIVDWREE